MHLREYNQKNIALGGEAAVSFISNLSNVDATKLMNKVWRYIYQFEKQFSRFIPMSELSSFNNSAGLKTIISSEFKDILNSAKHMSELTEGLYNPFILPALHRAGYVNSALSGYENDQQEDYSKRKVVGINKLKINDNLANIPYGTAIDLGGCGKGYLLDRIGELLLNYNVSGYWLSFSGDIATYGHDIEGKEIFINIQDSRNLSGTLDWLIKCPINSFAIGTSGTFQRASQKSNNNDWHHIINPKTLKPALTDVLLATVCAPRAILADVLASCAVILSSGNAEKFLKLWGATNWLIQFRKDDGSIGIKKQGNVFIKQKDLILNIKDVNYA